MHGFARRLFTLRAEPPIPYREMMGDLDFLVRIKTEYPDPKALLEAYGRSVAHGCFRVPAKLAAGRPFVLAFLTKSNVAAVKGTAEVIGHEENATWVRFLSAADPRRDADVVLTDVQVVVVPSTVVTKPIRSNAIAGEEGCGAVPAPLAERAAALALPPGRLEARPGARPGSKIERSVADAPPPTATGTGRSPAVPRAAPPGRLAGKEGARDPRKATPLRSMPAISVAPVNAGPNEGDAREETASMRRLAERPQSSSPAIAMPRVRSARRSAQHPAVRLVTPLTAESSPGGEAELSANRTTQPRPPGPGEPTAGGPDVAPAASSPPHHLADPGYPSVVRTRGPSRPPSKQPRGLPVMPAIAVEGARPKPPSPPMHHVHPMNEPSQLLRAVPMASSSGPLPEGTGQERAQQDEDGLGGGPPRQEVSGAMPLVSVVPWWTQPPERAATRSPAHGAAGMGSPHASAEAAVDFAEASGPDLRRAQPEDFATRNAYPRPPTMAEHAAPTAIISDERSAGRIGGAGSAESQLVEAARRSAVVEVGAAPVARRVMWGSIAIALTCVAVAIGAVWWALELRASAKTGKPTPAAATSAAGSAAAAASAPGSAAAAGSGSASASGSAAASAPASASARASAPGSAPAPASASAAAPSCQLRISATSNPAAISIAGQARGETPSLVDVPCGAVAVELRRARYAPATRTLEAKPGVTEVEVRLARPIVSVRILSRPAGVTVRLNGRDLGKTPLSAEVPAFEHATLIWIAGDGGTKTQQIYPQEDGDSFTAIMGR